MKILAGNLLLKVRIGIKLRHLFKNWIFALFSYIVGNKRIHVICRDGSSDYLDRVIFGRLVRAYYNGFVRDYLCRDGIIIDSHGNKIPINEFRSLTLAGLRCGWRYVDGFWVLNDVRFKHLYHTIYEVFNMGSYEILDVSGKYVIDIGAFVGDSTIYFLMRGSRFVIAVEPHPWAFDELLINVRANGLLGRVLPINTAISYGNDYVCINSGASTIDAISTYFNRHADDCMFIVKAMRLSDLMNSINARDSTGLVLKLDCEGCELDIVTKDYDALLNFDELIIEWHSRKHGTPVDIALNILKDFNCVIIKNHLLHCVRKHRPS